MTHIRIAILAACIFLAFQVPPAHAKVVGPSCGGVVTGVATCTFICGQGSSFTLVSFTGAGKVSATCMGTPSASCATGAAGACTDYEPTPTNGQLLGVCTAEGVGVFACSLAYGLPPAA